MSVRAARPRLYRAVFAFLVALGLAAGATPAHAQGVTTGAVRGTIKDQQGQPIVGATVQLVNSATGARFGANSGEGGAFFIANVVVGGYTLEARAIGFRPARRPQTVSLGRVEEVALTLEASTVELTAIEVAGAAENSLASPNRTGVAVSVDRTLIANLPSISHNFADFAATNSLVNNTSGTGGTGVSIAGISDRFNTLQIDGGVNSDLFGLAASTGTPGGRNNSRPISVEAVESYQVLIAPYDVRQGGFTGGLINAITRSGTNTFHGSSFYTVQNRNLVGPDTLGAHYGGDFTTNYYGLSLGGPIIRDRMHFFFSAEWRHNTSPFAGLAIRSDTTGGLDSTGIGIRRLTAERVQQFVSGSSAFNFAPGSPDGPVIGNPDANIFAKISMQLGTRSQAEISFNRVRSNVDVLSHNQGSASATNIRDGYQLGGSGYHVASQTNSLRGRINTPFGSRYTNEAIMSYNFFEDARLPNIRAPQMLVGGDRRNTLAVCSPKATYGPVFAAAVTTGCPTTFLGFGGERFSHDNLLDQKTFELADNLTADFGRHVVTLGGRFSRFNFLNRFFAQSLGAWFFADTTRLVNLQPSRYEINLPGWYADSVHGRRDGPIANFTFNEFSLYAQDQYQPMPHLSLTFGVRVDFDALPSPTYNPLVDTATATVGPTTGSRFGVRTDNSVTSAALFSPRVGFNYDMRGDATAILRGGIGLFAGRTPYVWASNAYTGTGLEQVQLVCSEPTGAIIGGVKDSLPHVPVFTADPTAQPTACLNPTGGLSLPKPSIVYFDKSFKLPQNLRASLGFDRRLPGGWIGSFDALYTHAVNQFILTDDNLVEGGHSVGEANRTLYGTLSATSSSSTPRRVTSVANAVLRQYNSNKDYSYSLTFALSRRFGNNSEINASYSYSRSYDLMSYSSDISSSLLNFATLDGSLNNRNLTPSWFDIPHSVRVTGTTSLPFGIRASMVYSGHSGRPYGWTYGSDVNGDGNSGNDMVYVPLNVNDISLSNPAQGATLETFINSQKCLREARGTILRRDACRNPWVSFLDARLAKTFATMRGQNLELTANLFNVLSFLGVGGRVYSVTSFENISMLTRSGYSTAAGRGIYNLALPNVGGQTTGVKFLSTNLSRWKLELGARYTW